MMYSGNAIYYFSITFGQRVERTMISSKFIISAILGSAIAISGAAIATSSDANASAAGCQRSHGFGFSFKGQNLRVPKGFLCHLIKGKKRKITYETAAYTASPTVYGALTGKICNWRIDFVYYDTKGKVYRTDKGPTKIYCSHGAKRIVRARKNLKKDGKACARLVVGGRAKVMQCHKITGRYRFW
jgi:uncharacterized membrane protein